MIVADQRRLATLQHTGERDAQTSSVKRGSLQRPNGGDSDLPLRLNFGGIIGSAIESLPQRTHSGSSLDLHPLNPPALPPYNITWLQASRILSLFRSHYMLSFPFIIIDPNLTAEDVYKEKPFLFRVIMLVAAPLPEPRRAKMKRNVLAYLGQQMLVEEERRLELLQGLLVIIAW